MQPKAKIKCILWAIKGIGEKEEKMKEDEEVGAIKDTELKMQLGKTTRCIISASKLCSCCCCCCFGVVVFCLLCGNGKLTDSLHPFP